MVVDDFSGTGYTKPLRLRLEATDAIRFCKTAAENMALNKPPEVMTGNHTCELCLREIHEICAKGGVKPNKTIPYQLESNSIIEGMISVLTNTLCVVLYNTGLPKFL